MSCTALEEGPRRMRRGAVSALGHGPVRVGPLAPGAHTRPHAWAALSFGNAMVLVFVEDDLRRLGAGFGWSTAVAIQPAEVAGWTRLGHSETVFRDNSKLSLSKMEHSPSERLGPGFSLPPC